MVNVNVKASDIGFQSSDTSRTAGTGVKGAQTDQFKKLLQGKQDESQDSNAAQEVSKDAKQEKTEAPEKSEQSKDKDVKEDTQEEAVSTDDSQARGLLAAYQMDQGMRPELLTAEPEIVIEMPETIQAVTETVDVSAAAAVVMPEQTDVMAEPGEAANDVPIQTETKTKPQGNVSTKEAEVQTKEPVVRTKESEELAKKPETRTESPKAAETAAETPVRTETVNTQTSDEESRPQSNTEQADHSAAIQVTQTTAEVVQDEVKPQEVTKIYVPQTEQLPEKLTDQLLVKMEQGVQSFEIEIEPENLGKISVKIMYEDGQTTVSIFCTEKKALDALGNHAREIGSIIDRNLGGETKIFVEKQEPDYLNQNRDENQHGKQEEQEQQKERKQKQDQEDSEQFLQKLRLGLMG